MLFRLMIVWVFFLSTSGGFAATLSFDARPEGINGPRVDLGPAELVLAPGNEAFIYRTNDYGVGAGGGFCAVTRNFDCTGTATLRFDTPVTNFGFNAYFVDPGDRSEVSVYSGATFLATVGVMANGRYDLTRFSGVTSAVFADRSAAGASGMAYGLLTYGYSPEPVPRPGVLPYPVSKVLPAPPPPTSFPSAPSPPPIAPIAPIPLPGAGLLLGFGLALAATVLGPGRRRSGRNAAVAFPARASVT